MTMKNRVGTILNLLRVLLAFIILTTTSQAQLESPLPPLLEASDLSVPLNLLSSLEEDLSQQDDGSFRILTQVWSTETSAGAVSTEIRLEYGVFTAEETPDAWEWASRTNAIGYLTQSDSENGDISVLAAPHSGRFAESGVVARFVINYGDDFDDPDLQLEFFEEFLKKAVENASLVGVAPLEDFLVTYTVESSVLPVVVAGQVVSASDFESGFRFDVRNAESDEILVEEEWTLFSGTTFQCRVEDLPVGAYRLEIYTTDRLGRAHDFSLNFLVEETPSGSIILPTTQDSTLRAKKPHRNEGANPRLFLSHRLEARGKSQNPIVGFNLANEDLTGLTKATLVMNVQDCDLPRRWGNDGRYIIACPVNEPWVEGNGNKYRVQGGAGKTKGQGQGVTWFSPVDEKIQNNRPNGSVQWDGARSVTGQPTAPPVLLTNGQTGNVEFDVTQDVLAGFQDGWVIKKQDETKFGNIRFYSKEGAAGDAELTPRLILEFGDSVAQSEVPANGVLAKLGLNKTKLQKQPSGSELPTLRKHLQENPVAAFAGETLVGAMAGPNPALRMASQAAYRSWLA